MTTSKAMPARTLSIALALATVIAGSCGANAAPAIRTDGSNAVPSCVTPERLMAFLTDRNQDLDPRFREIARWYKYYGEGWRVRWDYAFFQMLLETNYLTYKRGDGRRGDVQASQNNFAGIGATGGGVRGERFADVRTGVHAQIQHLVAYSGERLVDPVAKRTRENQDDIIKLSGRLGRKVTFGDLARRWATDRAYAKSIDFLADLFRQRYCIEATQAAQSEAGPPQPLPMRREWRYPFRPPSGLGGPKPEDLDSSVVTTASPDQSAATAAPVRPKKPAAASLKSHAAQSKRPKTAGAKVAKALAKPDKDIKSAVKAKKKPSQLAKAPPSDAWRPQTPSATPVAMTVSTGIAGGDAPASAGTSSPKVASSDDGGGLLPWLPTFRITPDPPQPSRLGGPLAAGLEAAADASTHATASRCRVLTASYGGNKTLLIQSRANGEVHTALTVIDGFEKSMFDAYARTEAAGAEIVGEYPDRDAALTDARANCPE
jgi:hypothetical protein